MKITALIHSKITALLLEAAHENYKVTEKITEVKVKSKATTTSLNFARLASEKNTISKLQGRNDLTAQKKHYTNNNTTLKYTCGYK